MKNRRNTIQRSLVYEAVHRLQSHATAEEIYAEIVKYHPTVSRGTVYRNLNRLAEEGEIRRMEIPGGPDELARAVKFLRETPDVTVQVEVDYEAKEGN